MDSIGIEVITPGSTFSKIALASNKSKSLLGTDFNSCIYVRFPQGNISSILRGISGVRKTWV